MNTDSFMHSSRFIPSGCDLRGIQFLTLLNEVKKIKFIIVLVEYCIFPFGVVYITNQINHKPITMKSSV